jgi:hypothetical protein
LPCALQAFVCVAVFAPKFDLGDFSLTDQVSSDYIDENIKTLEPTKAKIVQRALGICRVAETLSQQALPSRRASLQAELTEVPHVVLCFGAP